MLFPVVVVFCVFARRVDALRNTVAASLRASWSNAPTAEVSTEHETWSFPTGEADAVEFLRFVTPYRRGLEAFVDVTPYSPLLRAAADRDGNLTMYAFIDTGVGNRTTRKLWHATPQTGVCTDAEEEVGGESGNGWQVQADLIFWPPKKSVDTRPRDILTLAAGVFSTYGLGAVTAHEGQVGADGKTISPTKPDEFDMRDVNSIAVFDCPNGVSDFWSGVKLAKTTSEASAIKRDYQLQSFVDDFYNSQAASRLVEVHVRSVANHGRRVRAVYDASRTSVEFSPGEPVFFRAEDVKFLEEFTYDSFQSEPLRPVGVVQKVSHGTNFGETILDLVLNASCPLKNSTKLLTTRVKGALSDAKRLSEKMLQIGMRALRKVKDPEAENSLLETSEEETQSSWAPPLFRWTGDELIRNTPLASVDLTTEGVLHAKASAPHGSFVGTGRAFSPAPNQLNVLQTHGAALLQAENNTRINASIRSEKNNFVTQLFEQQHVCLIARRQAGRVLERKFEAPRLAPGERVILQLAVTGHGWSESTAQCGEFCQMRYHLSFDDNLFNVVDLWRGDCHLNPDSPQDGTWKFSRNGWCPGSVQPGLFLDVTDYLPRAGGFHRATLDATVLNEATGKFEPYTNYGQGSGGDDAHIFVGLSMMVYDKDAVDAILSQPHAYTAAELAIREGTSNPAWVIPLNAAADQTSTSTQADGDDEEQAWATAARLFENVQLSAGTRFNFEKQAPWYNFSSDSLEAASSDQEDTSKDSGALHRVAAFGESGVLIQAGPTHLRQASIDAKVLPNTWGQVGLRLRLSAPPDMEFDFWDRVASIGLFLPPDKRWSADVTRSGGPVAGLTRKNANHARMLQFGATSSK